MTERQEQIVRAAVALFVAEGVGVSTARVAKTAGVSNGTLFNAFPTKQNLIDAIYLSAKQGMFDALSHATDAEFDRETAYRLWRNYLGWARGNPQDRAVMHMLLEARLVSDAAGRRANERDAPHNARIAAALEKGRIRGPGVAYVVQLIFFQVDLVVAHDLRGDDEALAFEMLCHSIGLSQ